MKKLFILTLFLVGSATAVWAEGTCPISGGKSASGELSAEKKQALKDSAEALKTTRPDLAAKLTEMADNCCGK